MFDRSMLIASPPLRFPGQYYDAETDLFQNFNRFYDASIGRYLEAEPMWLYSDELLPIAGAGRSTPSYAYAGNNPVNTTDPAGLSWLEFDRENNLLLLYPGDPVGPGVQEGPPEAFAAQNNTIRPDADPWVPEGNGPVPSGMFPVGAPIATGNDSNSSFGVGFLPIELPETDEGQRTGVGIHSGRADHGGPEARTLGCIRTTDTAIRAFSNTFDPVTHIVVP